MRIEILFYVTRQKIRSKKILVEALNRYEMQEEEDKAVSFSENDSEKYSSSLSRQSSETKPRSKLVSVSREPLLYLEFKNPINKMFMRLIYLKNSTFLSLKITFDKLIDVRNETSKHHFLKSVKNKHITLLSVANVPVRFRAQQRATYSSHYSQLTANLGLGSRCHRYYFQPI